MNTMKHTRRFAGIAALAGLAFAALAASCASTEMTSSWTDPSARGAALNKVAVVCLTKDPGLRRMAEDTAAAQLQGAQAVPSYQVLGDTDLRNRESVKNRMSSEQGIWPRQSSPTRFRSMRVQFSSPYSR